MIVIRFKATCRPETLEETRAAFQKVVAPSRATEGVISFDIGQDLTDPHSFIATEVFEDQAAVDRQESLPEVTDVMGRFAGLLAGDPEATVFDVSSSRPYGE
jgi:quinol monooxygenase YgiN